MGHVSGMADFDAPVAVLLIVVVEVVVVGVDCGVMRGKGMIGEDMSGCGMCYQWGCYE